MKISRYFFLALSTSLSCHSLALEEGFSGKLTGIADNHNGQWSWSSGGLGRLYTGDDSDDHSNSAGELQLAYKHFLGKRLEVSTHVQGRDISDSGYDGDIGLVELKARYFQPINDNNRLLLTIGQFFLPTSMENKEAFWDSPYTITYSSLNSWIGEEFRPIGIDIEYQLKFAGDQRWKLAGTAFQGNDSMGTLLAWRGWSYGRHRSHYEEILPLPNLTSLAPGGSFWRQQDSGTQPFGKDLDHNTGYAARTVFEKPGSYQFKFTSIDNRGDQLLHDGEYAWNTRFWIAGAEWQVTDNVTFISEYTEGNTKMGLWDNADADFDSGYILGSYLLNNWRFSARYDRFSIDDKDTTADDNNDDDGESYTFATFFEPAGEPWSIGAEIMHIDSEREKQTITGTFRDKDITQFSLILNAVF